MLRKTLFTDRVNGKTETGTQTQQNPTVTRCQLRSHKILVATKIRTQVPMVMELNFTLLNVLIFFSANN